MRIQLAIASAALAAAFLVPAVGRAQDSAIKKIGSKLHHAAKTAGNDIKGGAAHVASATHHELKKAGNGTKDVLHRTTHIDTLHSRTINNAARKVSHVGKHVGAKAKHVERKTLSSTHHALKATGDSAKAAIKH